MPFTPLGSITRHLRTRDVDEATAFMQDNIRPGIVDTTRPATEIAFDSAYFTTSDLMTGQMQIGSGWSFRPSVELDAVMVWLGVEGRFRVRHDQKCADVLPDTMLIASARSTREIEIETSFNGCVIAVCSDIVQREMQDYLGYEANGALDFMTQGDTRSGLGLGLLALGSSLQTGLQTGTLLNSPIGLRRYRDAFVNVLLPTAGQGAVARWIAPHSQSQSARQVRRADEFMRAHASQPIGIRDVADHLGISVRALQYAFRQHRDTTPLAVLHRLRLEGVREALLRSEPRKIMTTAAAWGFSHASRFSRQYEAAFGEKPSATIMRQRRKSG